MADTSSQGVDVNKSAENVGEVSTAEAGAPISTAVDGQDRTSDVARDPATNSGSLSPVESFDVGFYKVKIGTTGSVMIINYHVISF